MIKKNFKVLIITSIIILLPMLAGISLWDQLPEQIPVHWNAAGEVDGWSSKPIAVFALPLLLLIIQWLCALATGADPKKQNHSEKVQHLVLWLVPVLGLVLSVITYCTALGIDVPIEVILPIFIGLVFTVIGNYMPKCKQNYTIGIKIPWTLNSEENWNKTHRLAGWLWVFCGLAVIVAGFFNFVWIMLPIFLSMVFVPVIYSYILHRKGI